MDSEDDPAVQVITSDKRSISYAEMRDRVLRAQFGDVWSQSLTDDEQYDVEAGLWQASSASAHRSAEEKAKKIQWRHNWADTWLAENGLVDPIRRQLGLEIPPIPMKKFESAFCPVFGRSPENDAELDLRGGLERAYEEQAAYAKDSQIFAATPWAPPKILTLDQAKNFLGDEPRPYLASVVDLMAFGEPLPDKIRAMLHLLSGQHDRDARTATCKALASEGRPVEKITAERRRAARALFEAARRAEKPIFVGSCDRQVDQSIPPHYFDIPRNLGHEDNSISTDMAVCADDPRWQKQFDAEVGNKPPPWLNVRLADTRWFIDWLASQGLEYREDSLQPEMATMGEHVEPCMLAPLESQDDTGLIPLCAALHWIMTSSGTELKRLDDEDAWASAVAELRPLLTNKGFEVIGLPGIGGLAEVIPSSAFALINIPPPFPGGNFLLSSPSSIDCSPYYDEEHWNKHFNDKLYVTGRPGPAWTHLKVSKADILGRWPRLAGDGAHSPKDPSKAAPKAAGANVKKWLVGMMKQSPTIRRNKDQLFSDARERFGADMSRRSFDKAYTDAIDQVPGCKWNAQGRTRGGRSKT